MTGATFAYVAIDRSGGKRRGTTRAIDRSEAYRLVAAKGLTPLSVSEVRRRRTHGRRVRSSDVTSFTHQFAVLIEARIPLDDGLLCIAEQEPNRRLAETIEDIARRIQAGTGVAESMRAHADVFGEVYVETLAAAEQTGTMIKVLNYLAEMLEHAEQSRQQVRSALMYPATVVAILCAATLFLVTFVVPKFARMFESRDVDLPALTSGLLAVGESVQSLWWAYAAVLAVGIALMRRLQRERSVRVVVDRLLHRLPGIGAILVSVTVARFTRVLGLSLGAGLNLIESLELAGRAAGRPSLQRDVTRMVEQVTAGGRLSDVMPTCEYLPPMSRQLLAIGDEAADLIRMCGVVARQHERRAAALTKNISTVIEPLLIVLIATVVLVVALAIFLPMWDLVNLLS